MVFPQLTIYIFHMTYYVIPMTCYAFFQDILSFPWLNVLFSQDDWLCMLFQLHFLENGIFHFIELCPLEMFHLKEVPVLKIYGIQHKIYG